MGNAFVTRGYRLPPALYERLRSAAAARDVAEDVIVQEALELVLSAGHDDRCDWVAASEEALERVWDNAEDARYDNWRELATR